MQSNLNPRQVLSLIDLRGACGSGLQTIMDRPDADGQIEQIAKQFHHSSIADFSHYLLRRKSGGAIEG
jgi:hypothetical protein